MRVFGFLFVLAVLAAGAAYLTKPSEADAERILRAQAMNFVAKEDVGVGRSAAENIALTACKLRLSDCYELLRSGLDATFTDHTLYVKFAMTGFDRKATCYGAFTQFVCPDGLEREG